MGAAWSPESRSDHAAKTFEVRADGTIAPRLRKANHMQVVPRYLGASTVRSLGAGAVPGADDPAVAPEPQDERTRDVLENSAATSR